MTPEESSQESSSAKVNVWAERSQGSDQSQDIVSTINAKISHAEVDYLCNYIYPFLQLVNPNAVFSDEIEIDFINTSNGWIIHNYGEAISCSIPHELEDGTTPKVMTLADQRIVASEIADIVAKKGWEGSELIEGTRIMKSLFWIESKRYDLDFSGYTPTDEEKNDDERRLEAMIKNTEENGTKWKKEAPKVSENAIGFSWTEEE